MLISQPLLNSAQTYTYIHYLLSQIRKKEEECQEVLDDGMSLSIEIVSLQFKWQYWQRMIFKYTYLLFRRGHVSYKESSKLSDCAIKHLMSN